MEAGLLARIAEVIATADADISLPARDRQRLALGIRLALRGLLGHEAPAGQPAGQCAISRARLATSDRSRARSFSRSAASAVNSAGSLRRTSV